MRRLRELSLSERTPGIDSPTKTGDVDEPELLERGVLSRARLWQQSMQQARKTVEMSDQPRQRLRVRLQSFGRLDRPVFVIGCPRSGTTYLGDLLGAIPEATYFFEPQILKYYVRLMKEDRVSRSHAWAVYQLGMRSLLLAAPGGGPRPIEKNPNHVFAVDELVSIFPDALFVVITRDGRDVSLSLFEKPWHLAEQPDAGLREPGGYRYGPFPHFYIEPERREEYRGTSDLHRCIWIWRRHQEELEGLSERIAPERLHSIRYEDLVQQPDETLPAMLDFLDVSDDGHRKVHERAGGGRVSSVGRWRTAFGPSELAVIDDEAGPLLRRLGYG